MPKPVFIVAVLILCVAGCSSAPERPALAGAIQIKSGEGAALAMAFAVTARSAASYAFEVDDGAIADACFVPEGSAQKWLAERRPIEAGDRRTDPVNGIACVWAAVEAFEWAELEPGRYELVVRGYECPAVDCRLRVGAGFEPERTTTLAAPAT